MNSRGFVAPSRGVHRTVSTRTHVSVYVRSARVPLRATSRPDHLVENNIETTDSTSSLATVESESAFLGGSTGEASPSLSNILVFWKSSLPRADADTPKWPESRKSGGRLQRPPFLLRLLVAIFRMLPYAVRNQIGNYRFPESRAKRKQQADKHTRISRHRLETILDMGVRPSRLATYQQALTHPSAVEDRTESFERLELLGDGVLTLVARELLLERLPTANEGMITIQTSALVSNECISSVAQWLGIGRYVRGHCIDANNSRGILCDSFEALVGAVYTDKGLEGARRFITRVLKACPFAELDTMRLDRNFVADLKFAVRNKQSDAFRRRLRMTRSIVSKKHKNSKRTALPRTRYRVEIHDERTGEVVGAGESYTIVIAEQLAAKEVVAALAPEI